MVSVATALSSLEGSGQIPVLDRSTDIDGPDVNDNGVRDDIEAYVSSLSDSAARKAALLQTAKASAEYIGRSPEYWKTAGFRADVSR